MKFILSLNESLSIDTIKNYAKIIKDIYPNEKNHLSSKEFGKRIGFDIHTHWKLPYDLTDLDISRLLAHINDYRDSYIPLKPKDHNEVLNILYTGFLKLNSDLKKIKIETTVDKINVIHGAVSQFNVDDINCFIKLNKLGKKLKLWNSQILDRDPYYKNKMDQLEHLYGSTSYIMSPETLEKVLEYLRRKKNINI